MNEANEVAASLAVRWCWYRSELARPASYEDCYQFVVRHFAGEGMPRHALIEVAHTLYHTERK